MDWPQLLLGVFKIIPPAYKWIQEQFPLSHLDRLRFRTRISRQPNANIKLKLYIDMTNERSSPVVLSSAYFIFKEASSFRHDPQIPKDSASGRYNCKFLNEKGDLHCEINYLLRTGATTHSYIALVSVSQKLRTVDEHITLTK